MRSNSVRCPVLNILASLLIRRLIIQREIVMRHYEIMLLIHPDQSEQVPSMLERYQEVIKKEGGAVHRLEDLGRRQLAYPINKAYKAHYVLLNIECNIDTLNELKHNFRFNDAVIRELILQRKEAVTVPSILTKKEKAPESETATEAKTAESA